MYISLFDCKDTKIVGISIPNSPSYISMLYAQESIEIAGRKQCFHLNIRPFCLQ